MNKDDLVVSADSDFIGHIDDISWITLARLGSEGLVIDLREWNGFVEVVNSLDKKIKETNQ